VILILILNHFKTGDFDFDFKSLHKWSFPTLHRCNF